MSAKWAARKAKKQAAEHVRLLEWRQQMFLNNPYIRTPSFYELLGNIAQGETATINGFTITCTLRVSIEHKGYGKEIFTRSEGLFTVTRPDGFTRTEVDNGQVGSMVQAAK